MTLNTNILVTRSSGGGNGGLLKVEQQGTNLTDGEIDELIKALRNQVSGRKWGLWTGKSTWYGTLNK